MSQELFSFGLGRYSPAGPYLPHLKILGRRGGHEAILEAIDRLFPCSRCRGHRAGLRTGAGKDWFANAIDGGALGRRPTSRGGGALVYEATPRHTCRSPGGADRTRRTP